ncbi:MAG: DUF1553 domain-containing protein [Pirellulaceae bacterium]|nr:DUF1553 domain-containing protein [Pirellulaceae bacterium]
MPRPSYWEPFSAAMWAWLLLSNLAQAAEPTYETDIRPLLKAHCFQCHGERGIKEGNLDLRLRKLIARGGDSGPALLPGDASGSLLIQRVSSGEMPPGEDQRLSHNEIDLLRRWVAAGAPTRHGEPEALDAEIFFTPEERNWWSFQPVRRPAVPLAKHDVANPIDAFILSGLEQEIGGDPAEPPDLAPLAGRPTLARRVYLDMLGLPPQPEDVRQFVDDASPDAWWRLVDRVLASPRYGERWGRHWLDVAGYADSDGYTDEDRVRDDAWRYRDYVIRAFNQDKPFSQFVTEQLAGDELIGWPRPELRPEQLDQLAATGFLRMAPDGTASSGIDQDLARNQVVADTLQIVGSTLLGMTIHCAQCHDHRYDPIPQRDYYQLRAILEPAFDWKDWPAPAARRVSLYTERDRQERSAIEARAQEVDARRQERVDFYIDKTLHQELLLVADELREPLLAAFRAKPADRSAEQKKLLEAHVSIANITAGSLYLYDRRRDARAKELEARHQAKLSEALQRVRNQALDALDDATRAALLAAADADPQARTPSQQQLIAEHPAVFVTAETLSTFDAQAAADLEQYVTAAAEIRRFRIRDELQQLADQAQAIRNTIPTEHFLRVVAEKPHNRPATFVFHRGDHQQPKEQVGPRGLSVLDAPELAPVDGLATSGRRLQFARHLTDGKHPLVARVFVNRLWAHHFGRGIVSTTGDLGYLGDRPTHPELLDWLAAEFVESRWSTKHIQRLILTSRVYQQSAVGDPRVVAADPENRLLGRWPLRRLEAEAVRDSILALSGELIGDMYGEPVPVMEDEVGQIVLGKENLDGERKPTKPIPLLGNEFRRSLYVQVRRTRPLGMLESFDLPELAPHCTERASSNVSPQSLLMMNSDFVVEMSSKMADRLLREHPGDPQQQLQRGWELIVGRPADDAQQEQARRFLELQTDTFRQSKPEGLDAHRAALATWCQALLGSSRFLYIE